MNEYVLWGSIFLVSIVLTILALIYLYTRFGKFYIINKLAGESKAKKRLLALVPMICIFLYLGFSFVPAVVVVIHLVVFWLVTDIVFKLIRRKVQFKTKLYLEGIVALIITALYLTTAWIIARNVVPTHYTVETNKLPTGENFRVVMFSDSHLGTTFNGEKLAEYIREMGEADPDVLVIVGDYVDDSSKRADMVDATAAFKEISPTYGTYYVFGNHDVGYGGYRDFNANDLVNELEANNVNVITDSTVPLGDNVVLVGREDKSMQVRADIESLIKDVPKEKFTLVLNHQPNDQHREAAAGVDLVLSGHTHGGQLIPVTYAGEWMGVNDQTKGVLVRNNTTFIVSDGISDWAIPFKTGCKAEYLIVDIKGK